MPYLTRTPLVELCLGVSVRPTLAFHANSYFYLSSTRRTSLPWTQSTLLLSASLGRLLPPMPS